MGIVSSLQQHPLYRNATGTPYTSMGVNTPAVSKLVSAVHHLVNVSELLVLFVALRQQSVSNLTVSN